MSAFWKTATALIMALALVPFIGSPRASAQGPAATVEKLDTLEIDQKGLGADAPAEAEDHSHGSRFDGWSGKRLFPSL